MTANPWLVPITTLRRSIGNRAHEQRVGRIGELQVADTRVAGVDPDDSFGGEEAFFDQDLA